MADNESGTKWRVFLTEDAQAELDRIPNRVQDRIHARLLELRDGLSTASARRNVKKMRGRRDEWRLRIGAYRVIFSVDWQGRTFTVFKIGHRREVYR